MRAAAARVIAAVSRPSGTAATRKAQRAAEEMIVARLGGDAAIAIGALLVFLTLLNGAETSTAIAVGVIGSFALIVGVVMRFRPGRIPLALMDALAVLAAGLLVILGHFGGAARPAIPGFYLMMGTIIFSVRRTRVVIVHYSLLGLSYVGVLWAGPNRAYPISRWLGLMAAIAIGGGFVRWLVSLGSRLAVSEQEAREVAEHAGSALAEQSLAKSSFISRMSHELRTPLNVVLGFSDLLAERTAGPLTERQASYVTDICSAARHLASLVNDVLHLTSVEAGHLELETNPVAIDTVLDEAVRMVRAQAEARGVSIRIEGLTSKRILDMDSRKVRQVVVNLLTNAIKFTSRGGTVTLSARDTAAGVRVTVRDEGTGIAPEESERIFEQYATTVGATEGTGLGLPLSRRIIEAHGGMLTLVHSAIGVGSVFAFELPERVHPPEGAPVAVMESVTSRPGYSAFAEPGSVANLALIVAVGSWFAYSAAVVNIALALVTNLSMGHRIGLVGLAITNAGSAYIVRRSQSRLQQIGLHVWGGLGTIIISIGVYYSGSFIDLYPLVYGWVPMVAFALWNRRPALGHVVWVMVSYAVVLNLRPFHDRASLWLMVMTVICFNAAVVSFLTDRLRNLVITEQLARRTAERVRAELAAMTAHKSEFLANMSHELRTPLNAIVGFADLLHSEVAGELQPRQRAYVEDIQSAARRLTVIINDVLDLAKLEAGQFHIDVEQVAIVPLLDLVAARARDEAKGRIEITVDVEPGLQCVTADGHRLEQVLTNLAVNGVKFTPDGGRVSLTACSLGARVRIDVTDTGIGILPEQQARIFDPFHQGTRMIGNRLPEGTGLGLTLAKNLIELHGGQITLRSAPDAGSTFSIELPVTPPDAPPASLAATAGAV